MSKLLAARGAHSPRLSSKTGSVARGMLGECRAWGGGGNGPDMVVVPGKLRRQAPRTLALPERPVIDPTNNASKRALCHAVELRKIIGQDKGGPGATGRPAGFAACARVAKAGRERVRIGHPDGTRAA